MLTAQDIKKAAKSLGAATCGIGDIKHFIGDDPQHNPLSILPDASCVIGFGIPVPRGLYNVMADQRQVYNYVNLGVKYIDETFAEIFLLKMGAMIENEGYDACLQRYIPGFKVKGDETTNPEVNSIYQLKYAEPVAPGKPAPDVIIDYNKAAVVCGLGSIGRHGKIIAPKYGTYMRYVFIVTDMPLDCDEPFAEQLCDNCGLCAGSCPGKAIGQEGVDTWQCSVYYRGAHKSNPLMKETTLEGHPEREAILNGEKRFTAEEAKAIYPELKFLPNTHFGYVPCLCGKKCETICYQHLKEVGKL